MSEERRGLVFSPELERRLLNRLCDTFKESGLTDVEVVKADDSDKDVLITLHEDFGLPGADARGEFFFDPDEERGYTMLCMRIIFCDAPEEAVFALCLESAFANSRIPVGGFSYDPRDGIFSYDYRVPIPSGLSEDEILEEADSCIALSLSSAERFAVQLQQIVGV